MNLLIKMGKQIAKHKFLILLIGFLLLIPSLIGMVTTRVQRTAGRPLRHQPLYGR